MIVENKIKPTMLKERKKWNKDDTVIFIGPLSQDIDDNNKHNNNILSQDDHVINIDNSESSLTSTINDNNKETIVKLTTIKQPESIIVVDVDKRILDENLVTSYGDIIVHQSPQSSSSTPGSQSRSIQVLQDTAMITPGQIEDDSSSSSDDSDDVICVLSNESKRPITNESNNLKKDLNDIKYSDTSNSLSSDDNDTKGDNDDELSDNTSIINNKDKENQKNTLININNNKKYDYKNICGITIHKMDNIVLNAYINHPVVKIHVIDMSTGCYLKKSDSTRAVCYYYENLNSNTDYIAPILTHQFNFNQKRSYYPEWEETIILNDDFEYFIKDDKCIIFFEIIDFINFTQASQRFKLHNQNGGWYQIAWAFLKLSTNNKSTSTNNGGNHYLNVGKRVRLQLYKYHHFIKKTSTLHFNKNKNHDSINKTMESAGCDLYKYWLRKSFKKYPATLYVTIKRLENFDQLKINQQTGSDPGPERGVLRSKYPYEREYETNDNEILSINKKDHLVGLSKNLTDNDNSKTGDNNINIPEIKKQWSQLKLDTNQSCKIPNQLLYKLKSSTKGCFIVKFSNNGLLLACATADQYALFNILIYQMLTGDLLMTLKSHNGLIYDLNWSFNDQYLLSASADCIVYVWDIIHQIQIPVYMLPHPSYVYCANFYPKFIEKNNKNYMIIVTGSFDHVLRVWQHEIIDKKSNNESDENEYMMNMNTKIMNTFELLDELENHNGYITTICFDHNNQYLFSGDSNGLILRWSIQFDNNQSTSYFMFDREYNIRELRDKVINTLICHRGGQRLLIQSSDGVLRMMDIQSTCIMQWFMSDPLNIQTRCCLSPCGSYIFAPRSDCKVNVFNADNGSHLMVYQLNNIYLNDQYSIHCIDFNFIYNILAISHYGHFTSILIFEYKSNINHNNLFLQFTNNYEQQQQQQNNIIINKNQSKSNNSNNNNNNNNTDADTEQIEFKTTLELIINKMDKIIEPFKNNIDSNPG